MENIDKNIKEVIQRIYAAEQKYGRKKGSVKLLAVSKSHPADYIDRAIVSGIQDFGENYLQEALPKINALRKSNPTWYFIGPLQSNKTRQIAENFGWVLSVDRKKTASRLAEARPSALGPLNICIQVNISGEASKSGVPAEKIYPLITHVLDLSQLRLRGIMGIPAPSPEFSDQRTSFRLLREIYEQMIKDGLPVDTLSMGMSSDLEAAIAEGSTMVRIGTAIFGIRQ